VPQFGRERAEAVAAAVAVAGFARLLQAVGGGAETGGADRLRCTSEPTRGGREPGEIGGAPRRVDRLLGFDGTVAELLQQSRDAGSSPSQAASTLRSIAASARAGAGIAPSPIASQALDGERLPEMPAEEVKQMIEEEVKAVRRARRSRQQHD